MLLINYYLRKAIFQYIITRDIRLPMSYIMTHQAEVVIKEKVIDDVVSLVKENQKNKKNQENQEKQGNNLFNNFVWSYLLLEPVSN